METQPTILSPSEFAYFHLGMKWLYDWQIEGLESIGLQEFGGKPTSLRAANGSGKTTAIIAASVMWFLKRFPRGKVIITSGSFNQIKNQLWPALERYAKPMGWHVTKGSSPCTITTPEGGFALGFSTSEEGRAEGWHPTYGNDIDPVFIITDEAKSVPEKIFQAFDRCTRRFQLWISSPGGPHGEFYTSHKRDFALFYTMKVTSHMCPHIDPKKIEKDLKKYGPDHPLYLSMHEAEFCEVDDRMILSLDRLNKGIKRQPAPDMVGDQVYFCDFAAGGNENVIAGRRGNVARVMNAWHESDTIQGARQFVMWFKERGIPAANVWGDAGGLGYVMIDAMADMGYRINRVNNQEPSIEPTLDEDDPKKYANRGSEIWFEGAAEIENGRVNLVDEDGSGLDQETIDQLTNRLTKYNNKEQLKAESKDDMKDRGVNSPDKADALLGCIAIGSHMTGAITKEAADKSTVPQGDFSSGQVRF